MHQISKQNNSQVSIITIEWVVSIKTDRRTVNKKWESSAISPSVLTTSPPTNPAETQQKKKQKTKEKEKGKEVRLEIEKQSYLEEEKYIRRCRQKRKPKAEENQLYHSELIIDIMLILVGGSPSL